MPKIRVLHIIKSLGRGGAETLLQETLLFHDKELFEFHCVYFLPWKNQMVKGIENYGGIVKLIPAKNNIAIIFSVFKIIKYIKDNKIDLIHCHLPWAGFAGRLIYLIRKIPLIYTEHNIQERYHGITRFINRITFKFQTKVIAVSSDVANSIKKNIKPNLPVVIIPNGINTEYFSRDLLMRESKRAELNITGDTVLIGTIAVFRFQKRLCEWVSLFKKIHDQFPEVRGCIIGDGVMKKDIMNHVKKLNMENYIFFPGLQSNVLPWLSSFDIFMMTSQFEGLPIALLEAMSSECAVVSTDAGGIKEVVRNGKDGFLEKTNEWEKLINPIVYLMQHKNEIETYGKQARVRVSQSFSIIQMVNQIESQYQSILCK
jgi:glycosyltransferase involved in cell wall biosynthesis